jgi:hypothetical protein
VSEPTTPRQGMMSFMLNPFLPMIAYKKIR